MIDSSMKKLCSDRRFKILFSIMTAFVIAASVTVDQQAKNLIKLLVVAGIFVTLFDRNELQYHSRERDLGIVTILVIFYLSVLLSVILNPVNDNTLHNLQVMSIGLTSVFIWNLLIVTGFRAEYFWWGLILCASTSGVYALIQTGLYGIEQRATGSSGKAIMFGDVALISGLMSLAAINHFKEKKAYLRVFPHLSAALGVGASILSGSRGGWIFLPFAIVTILYHQCIHNQIRKHFALKNVMTLLTISVVAVFLLLTSTQFTDRIEVAYVDIRNYVADYSGAAGTTSLGQRFEMWRASVIAFKESPIVGIGPGAFEDHLEKIATHNIINKHVTEAISNEQGRKPHSHAHNEYLNTLATRGLLGLCTVLMLYIVTLIKFIKIARLTEPHKSDYGLAGMLLVVGYMVFSVSESVLYHAMTANYFFLTLVSLLYLSSKQSTP